MKNTPKRSIWMRLLAFSGVAAAFVIAMVLLMHHTRPNAVTFFITGDTQGYLIPCGCKITPSGGLPRRASYLETLRGLVGEEHLIPVELGHAFTDRGPGVDLLNRTVADFLSGNRYGIVGLSGYDMLLGRDRILELGAGVPFHLAGDPELPGSMAFRLGGWGIGPIGDPGLELRVVMLAETPPGGAEMPDPLQALEQEMERHTADGWIVMGEISTQTAARILNDAREVLAVIAMWKGTITSKPQNANDRWVVFTGDRGRRVCTLEVSRHENGLRAWPHVIYLAKDIPSDPEVSRTVDAVLETVSRLNFEQLERDAAPPDGGPGYTGSAACAKCHEGAHEVWAKSPHSRARGSLAVDHQEHNPHCLPCHTTGYGRPGGFPGGGIDLSGIHCEACHGPGEGHPERRLTVVPATAGACLTCHTPRDSSRFDPEGFWKLIEHS